MQYRKVKKNGHQLSALGYGCMRFQTIEGKIDEERSKAQLYSAIKQGVNYIDTAYTYHKGESESFLGRVLTPDIRKTIKLATKLPQWLVNSREDMDRLLEEQLKKLQTEYIDYYLIHAIDPAGWKRLVNLGIIDFLDLAKKKGLIRNSGFSYHGPHEGFNGIVDAYDWEFCQIQYNYLDEYTQAGKAGIEYAASKNLAVIVMEPLRGGNLTRNVPQKIQALWDSYDEKRSSAEWALRWVLNHPEVTVVLSGMNMEEHIDENIRIASETMPNTMSNEEIKIVDEAKKVFRELLKIGCTGCQYCLPCPYGVNIPRCFELYNDCFLNPEKPSRDLKYRYMAQLGIIGKSSYASLCRNCGKCVKECPQNLDIPNLLKDVSKQMESPIFKQTIWIFKRMIALKSFARKRRG